ncbi:tryptophan-rich sensory protein [Cryomorpha ignava]|uniref:Tryptophan-rich sensory protein n=1 Tax=Cryomorpha ignava TaxID=101383 RepID=A0A7K3WUN6_9FLAO|nr:TspO/MBR family protein [Cryomorpha ignava]NEN25248.1 tryptophan-rich sensory protein [Cryomorpha ignava]
MKKDRVKNLLSAIGISLMFAVIGGLLTGDALENWFAEINQPWFSLPLWGWYIVGGLYYFMVIIILFRLFNASKNSDKSTLIWLTIGMIAGNEFWNFLFFGLESTLLAFFGLIPFTILVLVLYIRLLKFQKITAWILFPYLIWLVYDILWTYNLWIMNK